MFNLLTDFCWMCCGDWKSHGSEYYECSRYKSNPNIVNESAGIQAREALKKYLFYFERVIWLMKLKECFVSRNYVYTGFFCFLKRNNNTYHITCTWPYPSLGLSCLGKVLLLFLFSIWALLFEEKGHFFSFSFNFLKLEALNFVNSREGGWMD